tara:strand:- start:399 stop:1004 length:606 start_codon:yes stop_codon:yes gene_type:complete
MSQISLKSISGITSITTPAGVDNQFTLHINDTTEALKLDGVGNLHFHNHLNITGITTASNFKTGSSNLHSTGFEVNNINASGVITATTFSGALAASNLTGALPALDGSNLTGIVGGKFNGPVAGILTTSTVGIQTADVTSADLVGAATSMVGLYIGDGHLLFSNYLNKSGGYYITTGLNALNAGPVTLGSTMTLDGAWVIV